jgi:hypothetical protein
MTVAAIAMADKKTYACSFDGLVKRYHERNRHQLRG